jgi:hypothetical protein
MPLPGAASLQSGRTGDGLCITSPPRQRTGSDHGELIVLYLGMLLTMVIVGSKEWSVTR